jgi:transposase
MKKNLRYDFEKETDKDFLRAAGAMLQERLIKLQIEVTQLKLQQSLDEAIKSKLTGELLVLRRKIFDSKQEKKEKLKKLKKEKKKKKVNLVHNTNENKNDLESQSGKNEKINLESQEVKHELKSDTCPFCDEDHGLEELNNLFEESTEYDVDYTYYILKRHKKKKYKCKKCKKIVTAPGPPKLKEGGNFSVQMAVQIACDKFEYHLPLERQRIRMERVGLTVSVKTLYSITDHLYSLVYELNEMNRLDILNGDYICIDESPIPFFNKSKSSGYAWTMSNNIAAYYQFEPTRSQDVAREMMKGFKGIVVTDGYESYHFLEDNSDVIHVYCWSHVRRYFYNAMIEDDDAGVVVDYIDELYDIEHNAQNFADLKYLRETRSSLIYEKIESWMKENEEHYLSSTLTGKAIKYFYNQSEKGGLTHFLTNERVPLDNNAAERRQRCPVMGRKNYQAFRSINGADVGMFFYSMIESCRTNGLNPGPYLLEMALRKLKREELETPYQYASKLKRKIIEKTKRDLLTKKNENRTIDTS